MNLCWLVSGVTMKSLFSFTLLVSLVSVSLGDSDWKQFRGPSHAGVASKSESPPERLDPAKNLKWKVKVAPGASSPIVVGDRLILTTFEEGKLYTVAYSTKDGKQLWKQAAPAKKIEEFHKTEGSPAASTPVSDGKRIVSYFGSCGLICYDLDGKQLWHFELPTAETHNRFGTGTSPTLADGMVILQRDLVKDSKLIAVNLESGSLVWEKKREMPTSYGSPVVWSQDGKSEILVGGYMQLKSYDLKTGDEKWSVSNLPSAVCTTPVVHDGMIYFAGWSPGNEDFPLPTFDDLMKNVKDDKDGKLSKEESQATFIKDFFDSNDTNRDGFITRDEWEGMIAFLKKGRNNAMAIKPGGKGDVTASHVLWTKTKGLPYVPSPLFYEGHLFMIKDGGLATLLDAKTGKEIYVQERIGAGGTYYASPVAANGHIYVASLEGVVTVLKSGAELNVVSQTKLGEPFKATPAIADNVIYLRGSEHLFAFGK
jgi:outer membrane protein assembly factor BamB